MTKFLLAVVFLVVTLCVHVALVVMNYLAIRDAFIILGFETTPISTAPIIGMLAQYIGLGNLTFSDIISFTIATLVALGFIFVSHHVTSSFRLLFDRRACLLEGRREEARNAGFLSVRHGAYGALVLGVLIPLINWDVKLFMMRVVINALNIPQRGTIGLASWNTLQHVHSRELWWAPTSAGVYGYIAATATSCLLLDLAAEHLSNTWSGLEATFAAAFGTQVPQTATMTPETDLSSSAAGVSDPSRDHIRAQSAADDEPQETGNQETSPQDSEPVIAPPAQGGSIDDIPTTRPPARTVLVVGSDPPTRVTVEQAVADPDKYHVDGAGRVWSRQAWERLSATVVEPEAA